MILTSQLRKVWVGISDINNNNQVRELTTATRWNNTTLENGWYFHGMVLVPSCDPKSWCNNREAGTLLLVKHVCVSVCMCWRKKQRHIMLTYIMQSPLSHSASHEHTCPCARIHTPAHVCCYTITVQHGGNRCPFRLRGRRAHSLCLCAMGWSWHKHLSTIRSSAVSKCEKT